MKGLHCAVIPVFRAVGIGSLLLIQSLLAGEKETSGEHSTSETAPPEGAHTPLVEEEQPWIDKSHSWIYNESQDLIVWFDRQFIPEGEDGLQTPPSRFRLGLYTQFNLDSNEDFKLVPVVDLRTDIHLPNLERRLRLFVSTKDPTALPDEDATESNNNLRVGATRDFFTNWNSSIGVKAKWPPEAFANVSWSPQYMVHRNWDFYPLVKPFWDNNSGLGGLGALVVDHWHNRWLYRQSLSAKWDQEGRRVDKENATDPTSTQFGENGGGYRWSVSTVMGYVPLLLDENDYGRRISGSDVAKGWGVRGRMDGNLAQTLSYDLTLFRKGPLYKDYIFYVIAPKVQWEQSNSWRAEYSIQIGAEVLLWGQKTFRSSRR